MWIYLTKDIVLLMNNTFSDLCRARLVTMIKLSECVYACIRSVCVRLSGFGLSGRNFIIAWHIILLQGAHFKLDNTEVHVLMSNKCGLRGSKFLLKIMFVMTQTSSGKDYIKTLFKLVKLTKRSVVGTKNTWIVNIVVGEWDQRCFKGQTSNLSTFGLSRLMLHDEFMNLKHGIYFNIDERKCRVEESFLSNKSCVST